MTDLRSFVGMPQVAPSWGGGSWGPAGQASGRPVIQSTGTELINFSGTNERSYSRVKTQPSAVQQYQTTIKQGDPIFRHDLIFNVTGSSVVKDCGTIPYAGQLRNIGHVNSILAGVSDEPGSRKIFESCKTATDVVNQFRMLGVGRHFGPHTDVGAPNKLPQGMFLVGHRGHETIFNYWEYNHYEGMLNDPEIGPSMRKYLLCPGQITTMAHLWFILIKIPRASSTSFSAGLSEQRDKTLQGMSAQESSRYHWAFIPVATKSVEFPDFLLVGKDENKKLWFGQKIYVGRCMYRRHGNITASLNSIPGTFANAAFQLLFPSSGKNGVNMDAHVEASTDFYASQLARTQLPMKHGIPTLDIIYKSECVPGMLAY